MAYSRPSSAANRANTAPNADRASTRRAQLTDRACTRATGDRHTVVEAKCQVGFISFLVAPLYKALHSYAPALSPLIEQLEANRVHFVAEAERPASQADLRLDPIDDDIPVTPVTTSLAKKAAPEQRARA
jgi:hypothetical protein